MQLNKILEYVAYAVGGVALFLASLLVFALTAGVPAHEVAVVGGLFPEPEAPEVEAPTKRAADEDPTRPKLTPKTMEEVVASTLSRLPTQSHASPFEQSELQELVTDVKRLKLQYERDLESIALREDEVAERALANDERAKLLDDFMRQLDIRESEISLRMAELARDEQAISEAEAKKWETVASAFADGEVDIQKQKLLAYEPEDAARILVNLEDDRRNELLNALEPADFKAYNDAYSSLAP